MVLERGHATYGRLPRMGKPSLYFGYKYNEMKSGDSAGNSDNLVNDDVHYYHILLKELTDKERYLIIFLRYFPRRTKAL